MARMPSISASSETASEPSETAPSLPTVTTIGSLWFMGCAELACGRFTLTPLASSGAVTMKMTSSTSMTSTSGVTLMSASGW